MARIPDVTALGERPIPQPGGPRVVDQSGEILAQGIERFGNTLQHIADQRQQQQSELEQAQARSSLLVSDIQARRALQDDPNWQTYEARYRDQMGKAVEAAQSKITGRRNQEMFGAQAKLDLERGAAAVAEEAQRKRVDVGHATTLSSLDALRTSSLQAPDEATRAAAVGAAHQLIQASVATGDLTAEQGAQLQKQWTASYSEGAVSMRPFAQQIEVLSKPKGTVADFIAPDKREEMLQHAILAKQVEDQRALALQKQQQEEAQKAFLARMQSGQLTPQDVLRSNLSPFGSGSKDEFLNMLKAHGGASGKSDPQTFNELFTRIHLPSGSAGKITNENELNDYMSKNLLSIEDLQKLRNEVQGNNTTEGDSEAQLKKGLFEVAKNALTRSNPLLGIQDPIGEENLLRFNSWFLGEYQRQRQTGKTPQQLLSPDSPDYLGRRLQSYVRSPQQIIQDTLESATRAPATQAPARKQGETPDEYLKRIGKQ
jgi:hypothetical protein